jgi:hypothetical protein
VVGKAVAVKVAIKGEIARSEEETSSLKSLVSLGEYFALEERMEIYP